MRNLIATLNCRCGSLRGRVVAARCLLAAFAVLIATMGAEPALANTDCPPGSSAPGCAASQTSAALTASFHGAPDAHNGKKLFTFEIRFSEDFDGLRLGAFKRALEVTGGRLVDVKRTVRGENGGVTVRVRPSSSGDLTVTLVAGTAGGGSLTVPGPATASPPEPVTPPVSEPEPQPVSVPDPQPVSTPTPLTASFHGLPEEHDGTLISFEIRFSEDFDGLKLTALKQALQVTGGRVVDVKRTVRGKNGSVTVRVRPASLDPLGISLPATADCAAAGAICTKAGGKLTGSTSANIISTNWGQAAWWARALAEQRRAIRDGDFVPPPTPDQASTKSITIGDPPGAGAYTWGSVVNMNSFGVWGTDQIGDDPGQTPNTAPNIQIRALEGYSSNSITAPGISTNTPWYLFYLYAYPSGTDTSKTRVVLDIRKLGDGTHNGSTGAASAGGKADLAEFVKAGGLYTEFFAANAYLQEKGTLAQPDVTATFTGHIIAINSCVSCILTRGDLIGGDASVTATVSGGAVTASVSLTNLKSTTWMDGSTTGQTAPTPAPYPSQSWSGLTVTGGAFSSTSTTREIKGSFRKQDNDNDSNTDLVDTVGAVFDVKGTMTGGFVATLP